MKFDSSYGKNQFILLKITFEFSSWRSLTYLDVYFSTKAESDLSTAEVQDSEKASEPKEIVEPAEINGSEPKLEPEHDEGGNESGTAIFSYEQLKAKSDNPVTGIDFKRREVCSSNHSFGIPHMI